MTIEIKRGIVIGLGKQGHQICLELNQRFQRRHGQVPVIQTLAFLAETDKQPTDVSPQLIQLSLNPNLKTEPNVQSWLPEIDALNLKHRAGVRLALLGLYYELEKKLSRMIEELMSQESEEAIPNDLISPNINQIDIYLVGNLGDSLTSGLLIDLAYLIKEITRSQETDVLAFQIQAILLLPELTETWLEATDEQTERMKAESYALLKELDYYMNGNHRYRLEYPVIQGYETVEFNEEPPFEAGYCYLISNANEKNATIKAHDAVHMTAEWLYHIFMAAVYSRLAGNFQIDRYGENEAIAGYSSISVASLMLPLRYLQDYCARRLVVDLTGRLLTERPPDEMNERVNSDLNRSGIVLEDMASKLRSENNQYRISTLTYNNFSPFEYEELEQAVIKAYDHRQRDILPKIKTTMTEKKEKLVKDRENRLQQFFHELLDDDPEIGIDRASYFLVRLLEKIHERQQFIDQTIRQKENDRSQYDRQIRQKRGEYFNAAQIFGQLPLLPSLLTIIALLVIFGYTYYFMGVTLQRPGVAGTVIILSTIMAGLVSWRGYQNIGTTRANFINHYDSRLQTHRQLVQLRLEAELLDGLKAKSERLQKDLFDFRDRIKELQESAQTKWQSEHGHRADWPELLYHHPNYSLEESVIDKKDTESYYQTVQKEAYKKETLATLFTQFAPPYHEWLTKGSDVNSLWRYLYDYATTQAKLLGQHYLVEKVEERYDKELIQEQLTKIQRYALPFLRFQLSRLGEEAQSELRKTIAVHFETDEEQDSKSGSKVAQVLGDDIQQVNDFGQQERLSIITVRQGLPLYILAEVKNCQSSYHRVMNKNEVHSTRGNIALPEISADQIENQDNREGVLFVRLDPRRAFAMALFLCQFAPDTFECFYYDESKATTGNLNQQIGYYQVYVDKQDREMARKIAEYQATPNHHFLGYNKAEACYTLYSETGQERLAELHEAINDFIKQADLKRLLPELRDYLRGETMLEDWERIELDSVLELLLKQIPDSITPSKSL